MISHAKAERDSLETTSWDDVISKLNDKNVLLIPHCLAGDCADAIGKETEEMHKTAAEVDPRAPSMGAKSLCIPFEQKPMPAETKCLRPSCDREAK
jgi:prolyl-tRNA synthetase